MSKSMNESNGLIISITCCLFLCFISNLAHSQDLTWEQLNENGFGGSNTRASGMTVFDESLYVGTINQTEKCQVWRYIGDSNWSQVNENGFGGSNTAVQGIVVFDNELYVGTTNFSAGCQVWCYDSGISWTQVNESGFEDGKEAGVARVLFVFDGQLYAGARNDTDIGGMVGAQVWRYDGGTSWTQINEDGFGNLPSGNNRSVEAMAVLDGILYAGTWNDINGCQVWRYDGGTNWTQINENAFGNMPSDGYSVALAMEVFNGNLYVGTRNDEDGAEVWRYDGDINWTQVNETGFGSTNNKAIWDLVVCNDSLYAGTMNMGGGGGQVWRYDIGINWTQVNESGFGNTTNSMVTSMTVLGEQLCAGTHNTTNYCQVWGSNNITSVIPAITPLSIKIEQNYPNPFNPITTISFYLSKYAKNAEIEIYNIKGQKIRTFQIPQSETSNQNSVVWNGTDDNNKTVSSGIYFYKMKTDGKYSSTKKMILLK